MKILLVEDAAPDAEFVRKATERISDGPHDLTVVGTLAKASDELSGEYDIVLLDLHLPDSTGLETLLRLIDVAEETPIVVLTRNFLDDEHGLSSLRLGAQDYLPKDELTPTNLGRAIRYAIERHRLNTEIQERRRQERELREAARLEGFGAPASGGITARMFGRGPLSATAPEAFAECAKRYETILRDALERRVLKVDHNQGAELRELADRLGFLKAGPRDVIEVHFTGLRRSTQDTPAAKAEVYAEEGRILVLELMGYLVSYYRRVSVHPHRNVATTTGEP